MPVTQEEFESYLIKDEQDFNRSVKEYSKMVQDALSSTSVMMLGGSMSAPFAKSDMSEKEYQKKVYDYLINGG